MFILNKESSIANNYIAELRDQEIQKNQVNFRNNVFQLGALIGYELSKGLDYELKEIQTPLAKTMVSVCTSQIVLVAILRAALPFYNGFLSIFPNSESAFVGASRVEKEGEDMDVEMGYLTSPNIDGKEVIICDPMLATGNSILKTAQALTKFGTPKMIHFASIFAAPEGVAHLTQNMTENHKLWIGSLEDGLNDRFYIIPGLGDAGDLAFGPKI